MLSQLFFVSPTAFVVGIGAVRQPRAFLTMTVRDTGHGDSELRQVLQRPRRAPGTWEAYIRLPVRDYSLQLLFFDRVLTWPLDQPRHATKIFNSSGRFQVAPCSPIIAHFALKEHPILPNPQKIHPGYPGFPKTPRPPANQNHRMDTCEPLQSTPKRTYLPTSTIPRTFYGKSNHERS